MWEKRLQGFLGSCCITDPYKILSFPVLACSFLRDLSGKQTVPSVPWRSDNSPVQEPFRVLEGGSASGNGKKTHFDMRILLHSDRTFNGRLSYLVLLASNWDTSTNSIPRPGLDDLPPQDGRDLLSLPGLHIWLSQQCDELRRGTLVDGHMSVAGYCSVNHCALASGGSVMISDCFPNLSPRLRTIK